MRGLGGVGRVTGSSVSKAREKDCMNIHNNYLKLQY